MLSLAPGCSETQALYFGLNTVAPWVSGDLTTLRNVWRFWYQLPIALPVIGPRLIADRKARWLRLASAWVSGGFRSSDDDVRMYVERLRVPGHAVDGSQWYRSFLTSEMLRWMRGEYRAARVDVPVRWLHGTGDPVITPDLRRGYASWGSDFDLEMVDGVGHWIVDQCPELVLDRLRRFLR